MNELKDKVHIDINRYNKILYEKKYIKVIDSFKKELWIFKDDYNIRA
jgi:hypothetical protein